MIWGKLADVTERYLKKGDKIYVEGKIETRKWEKDGEPRYSTEIVVRELTMLGGNKSEGQGPSNDFSPKKDDLPF